jgi:hypothetical protein
MYICGPLLLLVVASRKCLRVFENRALRTMFGPKRDGVTGGWRKLHNEELHNLYSSPRIIRIIKSRRMRLAKHVAPNGVEEEVYRLLVGEAEGKRPPRRPRDSWVDNIETDLVAIGCGGVDWIGVSLDRQVESSCECGNECSGCTKRWESTEWLHNLWCSAP